MDLTTIVSTMNLDHYRGFIEQNKLEGKVIIINQTHFTSFLEIANLETLIYSVKQKGLTNSRNIGIALANTDIVLLSDDDVIYRNNYRDNILKIFKENPKVDVIAFNINRLNYLEKAYDIKKWKKSSHFKAYGSVRIAFRLEKIKRHNIWFDSNFGSGSVYNSGEETIFLANCRKKGLNIYEHPMIIADVDFKESTWREGHTKKFFFDKGAMLQAAYPRLKLIFMIYFFKHMKNSKIGFFSSLKSFFMGVISYKKLNHNRKCEK